MSSRGRLDLQVDMLYDETLMFDVFEFLFLKSILLFEAKPTKMSNNLSCCTLIDFPAASPYDTLHWDDNIHWWIESLEMQRLKSELLWGFAPFAAQTEVQVLLSEVRMFVSWYLALDLP